MIYLSPLPDDPPTLLARITALEERRERWRSLGRLTPERRQACATELRELRQALAVAQARQESEAAS